MSQPITEQLVFRPASEKPTIDMDGKDVLVFNPCDGWHHGEISVIEDDDGNLPPYIFIRDGLLNEFEPHEFYVAWAILPEDMRFRDHFIDQKGPRWMFEDKQNGA